MLRKLTADWFTDHRDALAAIDADTRPNELIMAMGDDLLTRFKPVPLLDEYDAYEQLMGYWARQHARRRLPRHEWGMARRSQAPQDHRRQGAQALGDS